ncbi:MAG: lipoyl synthase [Candidatus Methylomirabilis sp.]|nr:lipoyl synthase [Deltaproteobacteria bacterium]
MPKTKNHIRLPEWLDKKRAFARTRDVKRLLRKSKLHTVCEEARCPNMSECFSRPTATFLIAGDVCTRRCGFCAIDKGDPRPLDPKEPEALADAAHAMGLRHVVLTSVDRDDLADGGAAHWNACVKALRRRAPDLTIEILTPDFRGVEEPFRVLDLAEVDVFNHNLETAPRLYRTVRPGASYEGSLRLLSRAKAEGAVTKSGIMLGLGEALEEVHAVMADLRAAGVDIFTCGQYLRPQRRALPVKEYVPPPVFEAIREKGLAMGFKTVASAPYVRSSFHADESARAAGVASVTLGGETIPVLAP